MCSDATTTSRSPRCASRTASTGCGCASRKVAYSPSAQWRSTACLDTGAPMRRAGQWPTMRAPATCARWTGSVCDREASPGLRHRIAPPVQTLERHLVITRAHRRAVERDAQMTVRVPGEIVQHHDATLVHAIDGHPEIAVTGPGHVELEVRHFGIVSAHRDHAAFQRPGA